MRFPSPREQATFLLYVGLFGAGVYSDCYPQIFQGKLFFFFSLSFNYKNEADLLE